MAYVSDYCCYACFDHAFCCFTGNVVYKEYTSYTHITTILHCPSTGESVDWIHRISHTSDIERICLGGVIQPTVARRFRLDKSNLVIDNTKLSDAGVYFCIDDDADGTQYRMQLNIQGIELWLKLLVVRVTEQQLSWK